MKNIQKTFINFQRFKKNNLEIKIIENKEELKEAFRLTFLSYVMYQEVVDPNLLSKEQLKSGMLWDDYDFSSNTTQLIMKNKGKIVGRTRLVDGKIPILENFNLDKYSNQPIREIGRVILEPENRIAQLSLLNILNIAYNLSKPLGQIFCTSFSNGGYLYEQLGAEKIGEFQNPHYTKSPTSLVFRFNLNTLHSDYKTNPVAREKSVQRMIKPIEVI